MQKKKTAVKTTVKNTVKTTLKSKTVKKAAPKAKATVKTAKPVMKPVAMPSLDSGKSTAKPKLKTKTVRQVVTFKAAPKDVYEALMDQKKHARFSGAPAKISRKVGGLFSAYHGFCMGVQLELVENKKIVQAWRAKDWPEEHLSTATFLLEKIAGGGTKLTFTQSGVPENQAPHMKTGWSEHYWVPMKKMLEA
jgi:activator of HSP90 ATPase